MRYALCCLACGALAGGAFVHGAGAGSSRADASCGELCTTARSLIPPKNRRLREKQGACVELAPFPSCVFEVFTGLPLTFSQRWRLAVSEARKLGWTVHSESTSRGKVAVIRRGTLFGVIHIYRHPASTCGNLTTDRCQDMGLVDNLHVSLS